jgi:hypothetical protein
MLLRAARKPFATLGLLLGVGGPAFAAPPVPIDCGVPVEGSIELAGEEDLFTFTGSMGDDVVVTILPDGTWPVLTWPRGLVFEPGNPTSFQVIDTAWPSTLFNNDDADLTGQPFNRGLSAILSGTTASQVLYAFFLGDQARAIEDKILGPGGALDQAFGVTTPLVNLAPPNPVVGGLSSTLSTQQQALLGCGDSYFTSCDGLHHAGPDGVLGTDDDTLVGGIDLANTDASVLLQAFPPFEGTELDPDWDTTVATLPQPGSVDAAFNDGPGGGADAPGSNAGEIETGPAGWDGTASVLPGAHYDPVAFTEVVANAEEVNGISLEDWRSKTDLGGYDVTVDGTVCPDGTFASCKRHPFTGQVWSSEMAIVSWNLLMLLVGLGATDGAESPSTLDGADPLALGRCSYRQPQYCGLVSGLVAHLTQGGKVKLPSDGTYTILVRAIDLDAIGGYDLELTCPTGCSDGIDNDFDGLIDLDDWGCVSSQDDVEASPDPELWQCHMGPEVAALIPLFAALRLVRPRGRRAAATPPLEPAFRRVERRD